MSDQEIDVTKEYGAKLITKTTCLDVIPVTKYQTKTGIHLIIANVDGPIVNTYLCLATEAHDNDGLPHTLEHLVFLGSEDYPYKGLLDLLANKCLASGTNAWTAVDHTAYTLQTAGAEGTLALLPVYLDHVLYPVLTDHGFLTEVYHISGQGRDSGVVYSEMQGSENTGESRMNRATMSALYKNTGYDAETGGLMLNLRTSTSNEKVKAYHAQFYRPENLTIIIAGTIKTEDVFKAIQSIENKILSKDKLPPYIRPWQTPVPPLTKAEIIKEEYPDHIDDGCGMAQVSWLGPNVTSSEGFKDITALTILLRYLSETPISPLQKLLVEIKDPYAGDITYEVDEHSTSKFTLNFKNVPQKKLDEVIPTAINGINCIVNKKHLINVERIQRIVRKQLRECLMKLEKNPHDTVAMSCIADMLYSQTNDQLELRLNTHKILKGLLDKNEEWWRSLLGKYFVGNYVGVTASPSMDLMQIVFEDSQLRYEARLTDNKNLTEKGEKLAEAMAYNSREVPPEILRSIDVADCMRIQYHALQSWSTEDGKCPYFDLEKMPFYTKIDHLKTNFIYITLIIDTTCLDINQKQYLPLLLETLRQCPVARGNKVIAYDTFLSEIEDNFNDLKLSLGLESESSTFSPGSYQSMVFVSAQCEPDKYEKVVKMLSEILLYSIIDIDRLKVVIQKLIHEVSTHKRQGNAICNDIIKDLKYKEDSNVHQCSVLRQFMFLEYSAQGHQKNTVLNEIEAARKAITAPGNMWLHMAGNLEKHHLSAEPWAIFGKNGAKEGFIIDDYTSLVKLNNRQNKGCVIGLGTVDSCYLHQYSPGPLHSDHPDLPTLAVVLTYFTQLEGPMWRIIRGGGFAYSYSIVPVPEEGLIKLKLYKATNAPAAYRETAKILREFLEKPEWNVDLFASAKSALIYEFVQNESTPDAMVKLSLTSYLKQVTYDYNRNFIKAINKVSMEKATKVAQTWLPGLFDPALTLVSIVSNPTQVGVIAKEFDTLDFNFDFIRTLEDSFMTED